MNLDDGTQLAWIVFLAGFVPALTIALAGIALLARRSFALKKRLDAYKTLPIVATLSTADVTIARATEGARATSDLVARAQQSIAAIQHSRTRLLASVSQARSLLARAKPQP